MADLLEPCIPCIKTLLNGRAAFMAEQSHRIIEMIPGLVKEGRLSPVAARALYDLAIHADKVSIANAEALEASFLEHVRPPAWLGSEPQAEG